MGSVIYISLAGFEPDLDSNGYYLDEQRPVFELVCLQQKGNLQQPFQPPGMDLAWSAVFTPDGNSLCDLGYEARILGEIKISGSWVMRLGHQLAGVL